VNPRFELLLLLLLFVAALWTERRDNRIGAA
jgi:hypothetical protein